MTMFERSYSTLLKSVFKVINPFKKKVVKTECEVHKFINNQAIQVLKNDGHTNAFNLLSNYMNQINAGVVWADQDFKSSNHFYSPNKNRGLYGRSNAQREFILYYSKALNNYYRGKIEASMFYLGAACHLAQDMTVPQHVNIRLLHSHRKYEQWVIRTHKKHDDFKIYSGGIYFSSPMQYIEFNSKMAISTHRKYSFELNSEKRFYSITSVILILAQKTTAGLMLNFYKDTFNLRPLMIRRYSIKNQKVHYKFLKSH